MIQKKIKENIELKNLTTLKIGGLARFFISAETEEDVGEAVAFAEENELEIFILGGGSNIVVSDNGFDGLVLQINLKGIEIENENGEIVSVSAKAGEDWDEFAAFCVEKNLAGIECLSGIPGFIGGTPVQNVGAYGQEVSETIKTIRVFDRKSKEILNLNNSDCKFTYRASIFNTTEKNRFIVLSVIYNLINNGKPKIVYKDLIQIFDGRIPDLRETREAVCRIRAEKAMLVRQGGFDSQSVGSFFKNPIVSHDKFETVVETAKIKGIENIPNFKVDEKNVKIPAAWLIEQAGFHKGFQKGNAGLSTKHTLALTNRGEATAKEIIALKNEIQKKVSDVFGIELKTEPVFAGFENQE
ncbi:MAG: UDP-N-acetylmuramate dehydrogenase [Pyrinomonadaceae bacterium]